MNVRVLAAATVAVLALGLTGDALVGVTAGGLDGLLPSAAADVRRTGDPTSPGGRRGMDLQAALTGVGDPAASPASAAVHDHSTHDHGTAADDPGAPGADPGTFGTEAPAVPAPTHVDPPPPGVDLDAPTDTRSLYERAGLAPPQKTSAAPDRQGTDAVPPGNPVLPGLSQHVQPSCTGTGTDGKRVQVIYAYTAGATSRYAEELALLRHEVATVDDVFALSSDKTGGGRRVRWVHDGSCQPVIDEVALPASALGTDFGATMSALANAGYNRPDRKYVVFADVNKLCGIASYYTDTRPVPTNHNNGAAATYARIDVNCWSPSPTAQVSTAAHELLHSLGGVFGTAPNATANGHCTDEYDVMCYVDGPGVTMRIVCPSSHRGLLDCNNDDYFTTAPVPGSFLAQNWNTAGSSFLDTVPALSAGPAVDVVASAATARTGETVTFTASSDVPAGFAWTYTQAQCVVGPTTAATLTVRCPSTRTGTHLATVTATADDGGGSTQVDRQLTVTKATAPTATVSGAGAVRAGRNLPLTAGATGTGALGYAWQAPAGCSLDGTSTASVTAVCADAAVGQARTFTVTVTQADGQSVTATRTVQVEGAPSVAVTGRPQVQIGSTGTFTAQLTYPGSSPTIAWASANGWITGPADAATVTLAVPADAEPGEDTLTVTVTTALGEQATAQVSVRATTEPVRVTTRLSATATAGSRTVLRATLVDVLGPVLAGRQVTLQRRWAGTTRWRPQLTATTDATGIVRAKVRPGRVTYYRWVHARTPTTTKAVSNQVRVRR